MKQIKRMKGLILGYAAILIVFINIIGCGGGGSDEAPTRSNTSAVVPSECIAYCNFFCSKIGVCRNLSTDDVNSCATRCVDLIEQQGLATGTSCQSVFNQVAGSSCAQLETFIGLRSVDSRTVDKVDESESLPEMYGEEAATRVQQ